MYNTHGNGLPRSMRGVAEQRNVKAQAFVSPWF
jgi:hypothetical protein